MPSQKATISEAPDAAACATPELSVSPPSMSAVSWPLASWSNNDFGALPANMLTSLRMLRPAWNMVSSVGRTGRSAVHTAQSVLDTLTRTSMSTSPYSLGKPTRSNARTSWSKSSSNLPWRAACNAIAPRKAEEALATPAMDKPPTPSVYHGKPDTVPPATVPPVELAYLNDNELHTSLSPNGPQNGYSASCFMPPPSLTLNLAGYMTRCASRFAPEA
mmetsp:Transcript_44308/g.134292  ORF Transcript_44308/g.134292 Transcript_44308/m.134292 type:complete len:218 (-) Transcript_44308:601-1254(-)